MRGGEHTCHGCNRIVGDAHASNCTRGPVGARVTPTDCEYDPMPRRWPSEAEHARAIREELGVAPNDGEVAFAGRSVLVYGEVYRRTVHADDRRGLADAMTRGIRDVIEEQEAPCDVVALIVPAGEGQALFDRLQEGL